jgi:acyl carrier protein phosphodiesterase
MTICFASVGGFVMYADMLRQGTKESYPDGIAAIIQLGRALDRRIEVKPA